VHNTGLKALKGSILCWGSISFLFFKDFFPHDFAEVATSF
jgi:hypothetical protein